MLLLNVTVRWCVCTDSSRYAVDNVLPIELIIEAAGIEFVLQLYQRASIVRL